MLLDEPVAALRVVHMRLVDSTGTAVPSDTTFAASDCKISKAGGAFANSSSSPQPIATGAAGTFTLQLSAAEVDTVGQLRIQVFYEDELVFDGVDEVRSTSLDVSGVASGVGDLVLDANAPEGARTLSEAINLLVAWALAPGSGFPQQVLQSLTIKSLGGDKTRARSTISGGARTLDDPDGT